MPGRKVVHSRDGDGPRIGVAPSSPGVDWLRSIQRLAGNRATSALLRERAVQRAEPAAPPTPASSAGHGREPTPSEHNDWDGVVPDRPWRVLRPAEDGYNCFAWAVGETSFILTYAMVEPSGSSPTLDGWTTYLATHYGFARSADGLDPGADLILYGDSPTQILHAARRADEPYGELTFSSKIGGGVAATPVILHAPADIQSNLYGHALRSFWRAPVSMVRPGLPVPAP